MMSQAVGRPALWDVPPASRQTSLALPLQCGCTLLAPWVQASFAWRAQPLINMVDIVAFGVRWGDGAMGRLETSQRRLRAERPRKIIFPERALFFRGNGVFWLFKACRLPFGSGMQV